MTTNNFEEIPKMKRIQKMAMFILIVLTGTFIITAAAIAIIYTKYGFPKAWAGLGFMGIVGIGGLAQLFFKKDPEKIECDERDQYIQKRAALAGFAIAYLVVGIATMGPFLILGPSKPITTTWLPLIFGVAGITFYYAWAIAILTQYGWRNKNE